MTALFVDATIQIWKESLSSEQILKKVMNEFKHRVKQQERRNEKVGNGLLIHHCTAKILLKRYINQLSVFDHVIHTVREGRHVVLPRVIFEVERDEMIECLVSLDPFLLLFKKIIIIFL